MSLNDKKKETQAMTLYFKSYSNINSQHYKTLFVTDRNVQITVYKQLANLQYANETQNHLYKHTHTPVTAHHRDPPSLSPSLWNGKKNNTDQ